jgi:UDP-N-acetylmuramyl tripeptide synthase
MRDIIAIWLGRVAGRLSRWLGRGGGTTLPGAVARRVAPHLLPHLTQQLALGVVLVAGTNGKTTTTRMIAALLEAAGVRLVHNRSGANLVSGITAIMLSAVDWRGRVRADMALFECDEAALPQVVRETQPRMVVLHNLFRDQLDRYGEVDTIATNWLHALHQLAPDAVVCVHGDDPSLARLASQLTCHVVVYGNDDVQSARGSVVHLADAGFCRCGTPLTYTTRFYAHVGHFFCGNCGFVRPVPEYALTQVHSTGLHGSELQVRTPTASVDLHLPLPGLYNALNAVAAYATVTELGYQPDVNAVFAQMPAAFGRYEVVHTGQHEVVMALIKNPVGASETIRMLVEAWAEPAAVLIIINDRDADGTDVSWLWDADFEYLVPAVRAVTVSGLRAADMQVRLYYAGLDTALLQRIDALDTALDACLHALPTNATLYVLPTYTAMLEFRALLVARGWAKPFWQD